jgi:FAD:protein FMN transferase
LSPQNPATLDRVSRSLWSTTAEIVIVGGQTGADAVIDDELARCAAATSRFDPSSELSTLNTNGHVTEMSDDFVDYLRAAMLGVHLSEGLVDPAVGGALIALGYDRDFSELHAVSGSEQPPVHTWANDVVIDLESRVIELRNGARLDLGATSKAHCADRIAQRLVRENFATGACVSLGGDVATAGATPVPGWSIAIVESARERTLLSTNDTISDAEDVIVIQGGGVATSSSIGRVWRRNDAVVHHLVDPRTGRSAATPWALVSVHAANCLEANIAATAAHLEGKGAPELLAARGLGARLRDLSDSTIAVGTWPRRAA